MEQLKMFDLPEPDELLKLKHITGFSKLFKDVQYTRAWETKRMVKLRLDYAKKEKDNVQQKKEGE